MKTAWVRSHNVVWEEIDGGMLLVDAVSGARWLLNAAAAAVWNHCDGTKAVEKSAAFCASMAGAGLLHSSWAPASECRMSVEGTPSFRLLGASGGARRRPSPRGVSGPV